MSCLRNSRIHRFFQHEATACLVLAGLLLAVEAGAQTLEQLQLKAAEEAKATSGVKVEFGAQAILETGGGINRDRPSPFSSLRLTPELRLNSTYVFSATAGFQLNYADRADNPWDFTDVALTFADRRIFKDPFTKIGISGFLRYSLPVSISDRIADSYGAVRLNLRANRDVGPVNLAFDVGPTGYLSKYTTVDTSRFAEEGNISNNAAWGLSERFTVSWNVTSQLSVTALWGLSQTYNHESEERKTNTDTGHSWLANLDLTYGFSQQIFLSTGYYAQAPQLQPGDDGQKISFNFLDPKYGNIYVDLTFAF